MHKYTWELRADELDIDSLQKKVLRGKTNDHTYMGVEVYFPAALTLFYLLHLYWEWVAIQALE
jgi:hypothetical protein